MDTEGSTILGPTQSYSSIQQKGKTTAAPGQNKPMVQTCSFSLPNIAFLKFSRIPPELTATTPIPKFLSGITTEFPILSINEVHMEDFSWNAEHCTGLQQAAGCKIRRDFSGNGTGHGWFFSQI